MLRNPAKNLWESLKKQADSTLPLGEGATAEFAKMYLFARAGLEVTNRLEALQAAAAPRLPASPSTPSPRSPLPWARSSIPAGSRSSTQNSAESGRPGGEGKRPKADEIAGAYFSRTSSISSQNGPGAVVAPMAIPRMSKPSSPIFSNGRTTSFHSGPAGKKAIFGMKPELWA